MLARVPVGVALGESTPKLQPLHVLLPETAGLEKDLGLCSFLGSPSCLGLL